MSDEDVKGLLEAIRQDISGMRQEIGELRTETREEFANVRHEIADLRTETRDEFANVRYELADTVAGAVANLTEQNEETRREMRSLHEVTQRRFDAFAEAGKITDERHARDVQFLAGEIERSASETLALLRLVVQHSAH